jgi:hypothetical protein
MKETVEIIILFRLHEWKIEMMNGVEMDYVPIY